MNYFGRLRNNEIMDNVVAAKGRIPAGQDAAFLWRSSNTYFSVTFRFITVLILIWHHKKLLFVNIYCFFPCIHTVRYILSGMEFTDVTSLKRYKKKLQEIRMHIATFFILMIIYYFIIGFDSLHGGWFFVLSLGASIFIVRFVSLKRSYKKNRELL